MQPEIFCDISDTYLKSTLRELYKEEHFGTVPQRSKLPRKAIESKTSLTKMKPYSINSGPNVNQTIDPVGAKITMLLSKCCGNAKL